MNLNIPKTATATTKIQIEQNVPSGSIRKGPYAIERSVDPNDVVIKRRFGEGSKPLFQRDDIVVNPNSKNTVSIADTHPEKPLASDSSSKTGNTSSQWRSERHNSTDSSSPERYQKYHSSQNNERTNGGSSSSATRRSNVYKSSNETCNTSGKRDVSRALSPPITRRRTPEKVPYFIDEIRERDRLRRIYGSKRDKSSTPPTPASRSRRRRSRSKPRSRSISPRTPTSPSISSKSRSHAQRARSRTSSSKDHHIGGASKRHTLHERDAPRRDKDRTRETTRYRHVSAERSISGRRRRSSRSRSLSRSRTRSRERLERTRAVSSHDERRKHRHVERESAANDDLVPRNLQQPQIITIPVPVPADFASYAYSAWPTAAQWGAPMAQPPRYGAHSYHMPTLLPAAVMPPLRPPLPHFGPPPPQLRYGGRGFRLPQQYGPMRPWRPNYRARNQ